MGGWAGEEGEGERNAERKERRKDDAVGTQESSFQKATAGVTCARAKLAKAAPKWCAAGRPPREELPV